MPTIEERNNFAKEMKEMGIRAVQKMHETLNNYAEWKREHILARHEELKEQKEKDKEKK